MAFKKKTWIDRMVEFAGRRKITNVSTSARADYRCGKSGGRSIAGGRCVFCRKP